MKWEGNRESENVEDARGAGGRMPGGVRLGGGRGIGLGTIVIALVAGWIFGINPLTILGVLGGGGVTDACTLFAAGRMDEVLRANVLFAFHPTQQKQPGLVARYLAMITRAGAPQLIAQNHAVMARVDSRPHLPNVRCPVLLACGEADQLTPAERSREMAEQMPHAALEIVPGAGHMLTMEQPERVSALLVRWVAALK